MAEEFHDKLLHVIVDSKTGIKELDKSIEKTIIGYVYLVAWCAQNNKLDKLLDKIKKIALEFKKSDNKRN